MFVANQQGSMFIQISHKSCLHTKPGTCTPIISNFLQNRLSQYTTNSEGMRSEASKFSLFFFSDPDAPALCSWQSFPPPIRPAGMGERGMLWIKIQLQEGFFYQPGLLMKQPAWSKEWRILASLPKTSRLFIRESESKHNFWKKGANVIQMLAHIQEW